MSNEQAIANLLYRYGYLIDAGDFAGIGRHFGDAILTAHGTDLRVSGAEAIARHYESTTRRYPECGTPRTKHVFSNLIIEITDRGDPDDSGENATSEANYLVLQATDELALQPIITGRYHSRYEKRDGAWRFTHHEFFVDQVGDLGQHLLFDLTSARTNLP